MPSKMYEPMNTIWMEIIKKENNSRAKFMDKTDPEHWKSVKQQLSGTFSFKPQDTGSDYYNGKKWVPRPRSIPSLSGDTPMPLLGISKKPSKDGEGFIIPAASYSGHRPQYWVREVDTRAQAVSASLPQEESPCASAAAVAGSSARPSRPASRPGTVPRAASVDHGMAHLLEAARAEAAKGAAAQQLRPVRQRSEGTLLKIAELQDAELEAEAAKGHGTMLALAEGMQGKDMARHAGRAVSEPHPGPRKRLPNPSMGTLFTAARAEVKKAAAANQLSAVRQRSQQTIVRLGRLPAAQLDLARAQGQGTMVAVADAARKQVSRPT
eukprot:TRINITY_DN31744_c0_g1_i1.p1 TRINITY_DN31744_c0_g1~~TRINITY_DN31744_c0_g1_i1.p1  ORF type:complete len:341 (+),score=80.07 TRINITY_DN31744_c0_g1_i1:54-1025(+)